MMIPRAVCFGPDGKAVVAGQPTAHYESQEGFKIKVMHLPSSHYDFIDLDVKGKTEEQILKESSEQGFASG